MTGIVIPGLGEKLRLLAQFSDVGGWQGLADRFGRKEKTLRYWGTGNDNRQPNILPSEHLFMLRKTIADAIKSDITLPQVDELVNGQPSELLQFLLGSSGLALLEIINTVGTCTDVELFIGRSAKNKLVHVERAQPKPLSHKVALDLPFRLVFPKVRQRAITLVLQKSPTAWGYLGSGSRDLEGNIHVPGQSGGGFTTMVEGSETGMHRFVVVSLATKPSIELSRYSRNEMPLDFSATSAIATSLQNSDKTKRSVVFCDIQIERL